MTISLKDIKRYLVAIIIPILVGFLSSYFSQMAPTNYMEMIKPPLSPPSILFPIVWTILYILMGVASAIVYNSKADEANKKQAITLYLIQLVFNFFWSIIFFTLDKTGLSVVWIIVLDILVLLTIINFYKINKVAGLLMLPYLLWVSFATYLNTAIWFLGTYMNK